MTISSETRKAGPFTGNDVTTEFAFTFKVFSADDLSVVLGVDATGAETILVLDTDYTASVNADQNTSPGGAVTLSSALATGATLVITSAIENLQPARLSNNGGFYPAVVNDALDRATMQIQQLAEQVGRSVKASITSGLDPDALLASIETSEDNAAVSAAAAVASFDAFDDRYLGAKAIEPALDNDGDALVTGALYWDTAVNKLRVYDSVWMDVDITGVTAFARTLLDDVDAATARATLGAASTDAASETVAGLIELATSAEVAAGTDTSLAITPAGLAASKIVAGTTIATTSGTAHDFTGVPSWVKRITVMISGVSTNGTSVPIIQLGDSGGIEATGYLSASTNASGTVVSANFTTGFGLLASNAATVVSHGACILTLLDSATNLWSVTGTLGRSDTAATNVFGGSKALSATLTQIRLTTVNGTDAFDAGSVNILYE